VSDDHNQQMTWGTSWHSSDVCGMAFSRSSQFILYAIISSTKGARSCHWEL